ncbi:MAG: hypothetical protein A2W85_13335 [Bacteroidetes bacterium GWF2_41_31]|nr:MAG: hypothetical protein A2W85_13335 [Bacteroidetes bacterium GWF2_41_31]OFZ03029.1 MAG: hypothetical protein A2338_04220 [Bacteroidetes bacterium RIFOXYB12_FULL_41_6]
MKKIKKELLVNALNSIINNENNSVSINDKEILKIYRDQLIFENNIDKITKIVLALSKWFVLIMTND